LEFLIGGNKQLLKLLSGRSFAAKGAELALLGGQKFTAALLAVFDQAGDGVIVALKLGDQPGDLRFTGSEVMAWGRSGAAQGKIHRHGNYT
jgi:hypothetical protein